MIRGIYVIIFFLSSHAVASPWIDNNNFFTNTLLDSTSLICSTNFDSALPLSKALVISQLNKLKESSISDKCMMYISRLEDNIKEKKNKQSLSLQSSNNKENFYSRDINLHDGIFIKYNYKRTNKNLYFNFNLLSDVDNYRFEGSQLSYKKKNTTYKLAKFLCGGSVIRYKSHLIKCLKPTKLCFKL